MRSSEGDIVQDGDLIQISSSVKLNSSVDNKQGLYIKTFGCQMNEYDSQKLTKLLENNYSLVKTPDQADLILINTCSVREKPENKLYSLLGQVKEFKNSKIGKKKGVMIGVGGCVAQQEGETIIKRSKDVDFVFGTHNLSLVPSLIKLRKEGAKPQVAIDYRDEWEDLPLGLEGGNRVSAYISISRGCDKNCTYCIVPTTRGKEVSRDINEILREVRIMGKRGAKEVMLLGQTVNSYGKDLNPRISFAELLKRIAEIPEIERIRFTSPHPQDVKDDFIDLVASDKKICPYIHMPLQSGSDRILKLMNRNYRKARYLKIISDLKERIPNIGITTDIIVGFPTETEEDYQETLEVMREVHFQNSYSYIFSSRPGTVAEKMEGKVPEEVKSRRINELQKLQEELTSKKLETWVGKEVEVLLDGGSVSDPNKLQGRIPQNILVNLSEIDDNLKPGMIIKVKIESANRFTLRGKPISAI